MMSFLETTLNDGRVMRWFSIDIDIEDRDLVVMLRDVVRKRAADAIWADKYADAERYMELCRELGDVLQKANG